MLEEVAYGLAGVYTNNPPYVWHHLTCFFLDFHRNMVNLAFGAIVGTGSGHIGDFVVASFTDELGVSCAGIGAVVGVAFSVQYAIPVRSEPSVEEYFVRARQSKTDEKPPFFD